MFLATDLDGTFLDGDEADRSRLYQLINAHPDIRLAYVTGRGLESVLPLLGDPTLPVPEFIICDVGATVVRVQDIMTQIPVQPLQASIDAIWPGEQRVLQALAGIEGIERQDVPQERRCSFFCARERISPQFKRAVAELGCDLLYSADRYLDVLPPGVNKGSTLRKLIGQIGVAEDEVLVAGDTLNDLSMYEQGFKGVCVGDSEPALLKATRRQGHVFHAERRGCGGILEAIEQFGFLGRNGMAVHDTQPAESGAADLLIVYHRTPYEEVIQDGQKIRRSHASPNGIIPTLTSFFAHGRKGAWVAWAEHDARRSAMFEDYTQFETERYPALTVSRVPLSKQEVDIFYKQFSKEAFWPLLHTFWERARFREDHWKTFCTVNRKFAERIAHDAAPGATVWMHDYNLWMVPASLRELRPDLRLAFFHHTYFPSADVFNVVPWRREIIGSLLQCDYIGFHIPRQVENFIDVVRGSMPLEVMEERSAAPRYLTYGCAVGLDRYTTEIAAARRRVRLGAHPVGLDVPRVRALLEQDAVRQTIDSLRGEFDQQRLILSVERLDYTKGTLEKLLAYERLLEAHPELAGKVTLLTICVPAAREMTVYKSLQTQIEQAVGRINGRHARPGWVPVHFYFRSVPFAELLAYYAVADVMWITPLRDGLNLVAKEYVAVQGLIKGSGRLVLSEFAGAAAELKGAILTNPHDLNDMVSACHFALNINREEARARMRQLFDIVSYHDNLRWAQEFLEAAQADSATPAETEPAEVSSAEIPDQ